MDPKFKDIHADFLFNAILSLKNMDECEAFFDDICTVQEIKAISQRLQVAKMLDEKKVYSEIVTKTGASTATISRVNRSLNYGRGGYKSVFQRLRDNGEL